MTTINEKRKYEKPSMKVYELRQRPQILAGSGDPLNQPDYIPEGW